jgi:hypothetical protein
MSRNLGRTDCYYCGHDVVLTEKPRPVTGDEVGVYWRDFQGMAVTNAECPACLALYLAWVSPPPGARRTMEQQTSATHYDLSFRHSFNDEPSDRDLPRYTVERCWVRTGLFSDEKSPYVHLGPVKEDPQP